MRPINRWAHLMSSYVQIETRIGSTRYGAPLYDEAVTYQAHISGERRLVRDATGQQVVSSQSLTLNAAVDIQPTARVTLSTGDVGSTESYALHPPIVSVERRFDANGPHSVVLRLE